MYVRMHNELATKLGSQINTIVCLQFSSAKQTRIDDFFNCSCTISIRDCGSNLYVGMRVVEMF